MQFEYEVSKDGDLTPNITLVAGLPADRPNDRKPAGHIVGPPPTPFWRFLDWAAK